MTANFDQLQDEYWAETVNLRSYDHPVVRAFAQQRIQFISRLFESLTLETALDVGCGDGFGMQYMRSLVPEIHGCDRSQMMLDANPADASLLRHCDAYDLSYEDSSYDLVYSWELLHHIGDPQKVVSEQARVAKKTVLICEPNSLNPAMAAFGLIKSEERGLLRFTSSLPSRLMKHAGLVDVRHYAVGWFTPNRTPVWIANLHSKLPFHVPLLGLYTISIGHKAPGG